MIFLFTRMRARRKGSTINNRFDKRTVYLSGNTVRKQCGMDTIGSGQSSTDLGIQGHPETAGRLSVGRRKVRGMESAAKRRCSIHTHTHRESRELWPWQRQYFLVFKIFKQKMTSLLYLKVVARTMMKFADRYYRRSRWIYKGGPRETTTVDVILADFAVFTYNQSESECVCFDAGLPRNIVHLNGKYDALLTVSQI